jgi:hypothetical protein
MLVSPASRRMLITRLRSEAMTCGPWPVRMRERSSAKATSRTPRQPLGGVQQPPAGRPTPRRPAPRRPAGGGSGSGRRRTGRGGCGLVSVEFEHHDVLDHGARLLSGLRRSGRGGSPIKAEVRLLGARQSSRPVAGDQTGNGKRGRKRHDWDLDTGHIGGVARCIVTRSRRSGRARRRRPAAATPRTRSSRRAG